MYTIMTAFKPFEGEALIHQMNALRSWIAACDHPEILVFGDVPGLKPVAAALGLKVIDDFPRGDDGRARVDDIFVYAQRHGIFDRQVYVNGDIILMNDFAKAFRSVSFRHFLMIGQRTDVDVCENLDFQEESQIALLRRLLIERGNLHLPWGLDYFAYTRGSIPTLPQLYLGAAAWDNLMVYYCRRNGLPVIDASLDVRAFHQNHVYYGMRECSSAKSNMAQVPENAPVIGATHASHWIENGSVRNAAWSPERLANNLTILPILRDWPKRSHRPCRLAARIVRRFGAGVLKASPA